MPEYELHFNLSFADFRFLRGHMARRMYSKSRGMLARALIGVVLCATFIAFAIVINIHPYVALRALEMGYPTSVYVAIILCLIAAILSLIPAIRLRLATMRLQVSEDGPLLGPTNVTIEKDGLLFERKLVRSKYLWAAFQAVEIAKNALILPIDPGIGLIIPASAFPTTAARYEFAAMIQKRLEAEKEARK